MIEKILIANRGEIAVRIIRECRALGLRSVAVYSEADRESLHTKLADEAIFIGEAEPSKSYLNLDRLIEACRETQASALHPGYGFLSERAELSERCVKERVIFIGPPASAMRKLGSKIHSKELAVQEGVPITPGFFKTGASDSELRSEADRIGYPIMLKASAGGGGRGMRVVQDASSFDAELRTASDEALKAFGDGSMMIEKLIERPRHIEVQILADQHGQVAALFERECSIQRRHQKLIEESPSPVMHDELWERMRESAIKLCQAAGYVGAGTVEFMFDEASGDFYFLEVNARLQVEHPVTEEITGLNLVALQIKVANGESLDLGSPISSGSRAAIRGHAIEARIVAEDPSKGFLPSTGKLLVWVEPRVPGVRVETGYQSGLEVSRYYDSLLAKVIAHGNDRPEAILRLKAALEDFHILGVKTNISMLLQVLQNEKFGRGEFDTGFIEREYGSHFVPGMAPPELGSILAKGLYSRPKVDDVHCASPAWVEDGWRNNL